MALIKIFGKEIIYKPYMDKMYLHKMRMRLANDRSFRIIFKRNITDDFISSLKEIVNPDHQFQNNIILQVYGETGSGKSSMVISLCFLLTPDKFSEKNVCFYDSLILELAKTIPRDTFIVRDEGVGKAVLGMGSTRTSQQLTVLTETTRKFGLSLVFVEPEFRENELAKYILEVVDICPEHRLTRVAVKDKYTQRYLGAIYVPILPENHPIMVKYNENKDEFIKNMKKGNLKGAKEDYRDYAKRVYKKIDEELYSKKKDRLAVIRMEYPNLSNNEIDTIATFVEVMIKHGAFALEEQESEVVDEKKTE